ncbi:MAG: hypothetical protein HY040_10555 [Planctomycetes bacterium]|nr:hypothetical protein [Planctomycetota bacterium]
MQRLMQRLAPAAKSSILRTERPGLGFLGAISVTFGEGPDPFGEVVYWLRKVTDSFSEVPYCFSEVPYCFSRVPYCFSEAADCFSNMPDCFSNMPYCFSEVAYCSSKVPDCICPSAALKPFP